MTRVDLRALGLTDRMIDRRLGAGRLVAVRRGVLVAAPSLSTERGAVLARVAAALRSHTRRDPVASHLSAAARYDLPRPLDGWGPVTLTVAAGPTRRRAGLVVHRCELAAGEVLSGPHGLATTSPARTVLDCLRSTSPRDGLAIADAALHRRPVRWPELVASLEAAQGLPGVVRARTVLAVADERRESPLESWSAWGFHTRNVPAPTWQVDVPDVAGAFVARVDGWWACGLVGEADGRAKYTLAAAERGGADAAGLSDVLDRERRREQRLRRLGAEVVRWQARDVLDEHRAGELAAHLVSRLARRRVEDFGGRWRVS